MEEGGRGRRTSERAYRRTRAPSRQADRWTSGRRRGRWMDEWTGAARRTGAGWGADGQTGGWTGGRVGGLANQQTGADGRGQISEG